MSNTKHWLLKKKTQHQKTQIPFSKKLRDDIIEPLVIRRTRTDIENNEEYLEDMKKSGNRLPESR
ncbi:MAG: hypothetical protein KatS3mg035_0226 [Bacteroidia bacterium]|nr:MAG: hypothetical protein KatS3mg035_0226 [Bacteroidia bacterium]